MIAGMSGQMRSYWISCRRHVYCNARIFGKGNGRQRLLDGVRNSVRGDFTACFDQSPQVALNKTSIGFLDRDPLLLTLKMSLKFSSSIVSFITCSPTICRRLAATYHLALMKWSLDLELVCHLSRICVQQSVFSSTQKNWSHVVRLRNKS